MLTLKPSDLETLLCAAIRARQNLLVVSSHGMGKTSIIKQAIKQVTAAGFFMYPSIGDPTDAKGIPWIVDGKGEFVPFEELARVYRAIDAGLLTCLVLDDLGQGAPAVQASYMQLMDKLRGRCSVVAATNQRGGKNGVQGILEPVKSRFHSIVELATDVEDFCNHLIDFGAEMHGLTEEVILDIVSFLRFRPDLLCKPNPTADMVNSPCSRTWVSAGQQMSLELPARIEYVSVAGAVGEGAGVEFCAYKKMRRELPSLDTILMNPQNAVIPTEPSVRWAVCTGLAAKATEDNFPALHTYARKLHNNALGPYAALMIRDALRRVPVIRSTREFQRLSTGPIGDLIVGAAKG